MARKQYQEVHQDVKGEFDSVIIRLELDNFMNIKVLGDEKQKKEVIKIKKIDDLNYHLHKEDIVLTVNQSIFEQLPPDLKVLAIEDALARISFNREKDAIQSNVEDVKTFSLVLDKHGYEKYHVLKESIKTLYAKLGGEDAPQ